VQQNVCLCVWEIVKERERERERVLAEGVEWQREREKLCGRGKMSFAMNSKTQTRCVY